MSTIVNTDAYLADFKSVNIEYLYPARSVTYETSGTTSLSDIFGPIPSNAGAVDVWSSANTIFCRFDGRAVTSANAKMLANTIYRFYGTKAILDKIRVAISGDEALNDSESSQSGTLHDISAILYVCADAANGMAEWESSSSSLSSLSSARSVSSSSSSKSVSSSSSSKSSKSSQSYSSESSESADDQWGLNNG